MYTENHDSETKDSKMYNLLCTQSSAVDMKTGRMTGERRPYHELGNGGTKT